MPAWRDDEHEVARWCRLLRESGIPADGARVRPAAPAPAAGAGRRPRSHRRASRARPAPRAAGRRSGFAEVAARRDRGRPLVVLTGGPESATLALASPSAPDSTSARCSPGAPTCGALAAVVAHAGRVVCGDTGVAHLATAFGIPSVVLFGPTSPANRGPPAPPAGPPAERVRHRVLWHGTTGDPHAERPDAGLLAIDAPRVIEALAELPT